MDQLTRTFLPLFIWHFQKIVGPILTADEWCTFAGSFVPPPNNLVNTIKDECGDFDSQALFSSSERRRIRNECKTDLRRRLRDDPMVGQVRRILYQFTQNLERKGFQGEPGRTFKWRDLEADINSRWEQATRNNEYPEELWPIVKEYPDAPNFLWELALYGRGEKRPKLHRKSALFTVLGLDYEELVDGDPEDMLTLILSRVFSMAGLSDDTPDKTRISRLVEWLVRNSLPGDTEPETTPRALSMAKQAGLIHEPIVVRDRETGEVRETDVEDTDSRQTGDWLFGGLGEKLTTDEIIEILREKGIDKDELTDKEWRLIFRLNDAFDEGAEIGSKKGISLHHFFGDSSDNIRQQLSRLRKKIARLKTRKK